MKTLISNENVLMTYDKSINLIRLKWNGAVPTDRFLEAINAGAEIIKNSDGFTNILLDRRELDDFSAEARVWLKQDFMKNEGRQLIKKVKKLAAVKPVTTMATVMTTVFSAIFQVTNPDLDYAIFDVLEDAEEWINSKSRKRGFLKRVFGVFRSAELVEQG